jgi:hypothetical protein
MRNFATARVTVVPVADLPPATVLLAWPASNPDPLATAFVASAREVAAAATGRERG